MAKTYRGLLVHLRKVLSLRVATGSTVIIASFGNATDDLEQRTKGSGSEVDCNEDDLATFISESTSTIFVLQASFRPNDRSLF